MTPGFTRRRAERFHEALEGAAVAAPDAVAWVELVDRLRATSPVQPRADFVVDLRERLLMAAAGELPAPVRSLRTDTAAERLRLAPGHSRRERRLAAGIGALALVGAGTSMAVAAQGALPGETLYPLKRAIENVQAGTVRDTDDRGAALLDHASGRLEEVRTLVLRGDLDDDVAVATLGDFADQAAQATDLLMASYADGGPTRDVEVVRDFTGSSMTTLVEIQDVVPAGPTSTALDRTALVVAQIDDAAHRLCPACGGPMVLLPDVALDPAALESTRRIDPSLARPRTPSAQKPTDARRDRSRPVDPDRGGADPGEAVVDVDDPGPLAGSGQGDGTGAGATTTEPRTPTAPGTTLPPTDVPASDPFQTLTHGLGDPATAQSGPGSAGHQPSDGGSGQGGGSGAGPGGGPGSGSGLEEAVEDVAGELLP